MRDSNRSKALGWVLGLDTKEEDEQLISWAISQLASMHSPEADAELDRFANEISNLPRDSPRLGRLLLHKAAIEELQRERAR